MRKTKKIKHLKPAALFTRLDKTLAARIKRWVQEGKRQGKEGEGDLFIPPSSRVFLRFPPNFHNFWFSRSIQIIISV